MIRKTVLFTICLLIWCCLNWPVDMAWFLTGIIVSITIALATGDIFIRRAHILIHLKRYLWLCYYLAVLFIKILKANIDIICRLFHPDLPLQPGIIKVKTKIKSEIGLTILANSITFSSGTCVVDVDKGKGHIYVHWLDVKSKNIKPATELVVERFEKILKRVFD